MATRVFIFLAFLFSCTHTIAQSGFLSVADGLSNRHVTSVLQDRSGLIWVGTRNGLNRYDGYEFRIISQGRDDQSLSHSQVNVLMESADRRTLLIGTRNGLNSLDLATGRITKHYYYPPEKPRTLTYFGISAICLKDSVPLIGTMDGAVLAFRNNRLTEVFRDSDSTSLLNMQVDAAGNIWYHTASSSIVRLDMNLTRHVFKSPLLQPPNCYYSCLNTTGAIGICGINEKGLFLFDKPTGKPVPCRLFDSVNQYHKGPKSILAYGSNYCMGYNTGVLLLLNPLTGICVDLSSAIPQKDFGRDITCFYNDRKGMIWTGTNGGLARIHPGMNGFERILWQQRDTGCYSIRGMCGAGTDTVYIGTYKGLISYHIPSKKTECFLLKDVVSGKDVRPNPFVILNGGNGSLYMSSTAGFLQFDLITKIFRRLVPDKVFFGLYRDPAGDFWLGSSRGLHIYESRSGIMKPVVDASNKFNLKNITLWQIIGTKDHTVWLCCNSGLVQMDQNRKILGFYSTTTPVALSNDEVLSVHEDADSVLWICTLGGGLNRLDRRTNTMKYYNTVNGLPGNIVYGVLEDKGILWISTDNGLASFNKSNEHISTWSTRDGICNNEFNTTSYYRSPEGRMYFGSINGVTAFHPDQLNKSRIGSEMMFTSFGKHDGQKKMIEEKTFGLHTVEPIHMSYNDHFATFTFGLDNYEDPQKNRFLYMLEGLNTSWNSLGSQHVLRLSSIPAGSYTLRIKGISPKGTPSVNELSIPLVVSNVFYKNAWFVLLMCLLMAASMYGVFRYRIWQLEKIQFIRTQIASDLHDEVGSLLTRISIHTELIRHTPGSVQQNSEALNQIAETSRLATTTMSDVLWSVDARNDRTGNMIDRMREHADQMLSPRGMQLHFTHNLLPAKHVETESRQQLFLIFKECINNIAKHSNGDSVTIDLKNSDTGFYMVIADNGKVHSIAPGGQGTSNMHMRAAKLGGKISIGTHTGYTVRYEGKSI